jgi:peptidoglycan/LPS O-acetylase OafA/YrhL
MFGKRHTRVARRVGSEKHIDSLDGFRGIAILLVFFFHYLPRNPHNPFFLDGKWRFREI